MNAEELVAKGRLKRTPIDDDAVQAALKVARRDIGVAKAIFEKDLDWCYAIAYNAAVEACRALMYSEGYRPASEKSHVSVIEYLRTRKEKEVLDMAGLLDNLRKKRHIAVYDAVGTISETAAQNAIKWATEVVGIVGGILKEEQE